MTKQHNIKCLTQFFERIRSGQKTFEIRKNDRDYQVGDSLNIMEYNPEVPDFPHTAMATIKADIVYVSSFMQKEDYVVLGIEAHDDSSLYPTLATLATVSCLQEAPSLDDLKVNDLEIWYKEYYSIIIKSLKGE